MYGPKFYDFWSLFDTRSNEHKINDPTLDDPIPDLIRSET
jgi:hypothetical protein